MSKVTIEFVEAAGYVQLGTVRLWVNGVEVKDDFKKHTFIKGLKW